MRRDVNMLPLGQYSVPMKEKGSKKENKLGSGSKSDSHPEVANSVSNNSTSIYYAANNFCNICKACFKTAASLKAHISKNT